MKSLLFRSILLAGLLLAGFNINFSQPEAAATPPSAQIFVGETLKYEGKINKILRGMSIADLTFSAGSMPNSNELVIKAEAVSKGTLLKLFRYSFLQQYQSVIDLSSFRILKTVKHDVQKERVRDSEALFDYKEKRVSYIESDPKDPMRPQRRIASEIGQQMYDMISAIYAARLAPLAVGKRFEFSVSDSGLVYKVPFAITARELQKTIYGNVWCFRVEPEIFGKDRLIEQKGRMVIWMVDDARRTPVRSQIRSEFGKFDIKLKSATVFK